jgi:hypothetical protein
MHHIKVVIAAFSDVELDHVRRNGKGKAKGLEGIFESAGESPRWAMTRGFHG